MVRQEWKKLLHNKILLVVILAVIAIPSIYTTLFLGSMWDPYGNTDKLPVAVVNEDQPVEYQGAALDIGGELVKKLKEEKSLDFHFVEKKEGEQGLKDGTYYMMIRIPEDFSAKAGTLTGEKPEKMELFYETNPGTNYIASKMSETAMKEMESAVCQEVTRTYIQAVMDKVLQAKEGMEQAGQGAGELEEGVGKAGEGNEAITENLQVLADSTLTFRNGTRTFSEGLGKYVQGVETLAAGTEELDQGTAALAQGMEQVKKKMPELSQGADKLAEGAQTLEEGTRENVRGSQALEEGAARTDESMKTLNQGLSALGEAAASLPEAARELEAGTEELRENAAALHNGMETLQQGTAQWQQGAESLESGLQTIIGENGSQSDALSQGAASLSQGLEDLYNSLPSYTDSLSEDDGWSISEEIQRTDPSYLYEEIQQAADSGDIDSLTGAAWAALEAAQTNYQGLQEMEEQIFLARESAGEADPSGEEGLSSQISMLKDQASLLAESTAAYTEGVNEAARGSRELVSGLPEITEGISQAAAGSGELAAGAETLLQGVSGLSQKAPVLVQGIQEAVQGGSLLQTQGTSVLEQGAETLAEGAEALSQGTSQMAAGTQALKEQVPALLNGGEELSQGLTSLKEGTGSLKAGAAELVENGPSLLLGASQLSQGGEQIGQGAGKLYEGSRELGEGLKSLEQGAGTLKNALEEGGISAGNSILSEEGMDMFADPAVTKETQITEVENNGHAMAPYMMSVGLWVGCIAFSLMYPLTEYSGKLKSGGAWWRSKASVLYLVALLQAAVMTGALWIFDGFRPVQPGKTLLTACLASLAFMSIMYFFTNLLGKAGSFLMLVFMVVQLAGSVGTYPLELSGSFVPYLHDWVPFTYTVTAFRSTISGGESIGKCLLFLGALFLVFSLMTVLEFQIRAGKIKRGKRTWVTWLKAHGLE